MGRTKNSYTPEQVDAGLLALAMTGGNSKLASEVVEAEMGYRIPPNTLRDWRNHTHVPRYYELVAQHGEEIERRLENSKRALLTRIADGLAESVEKTLEQLEAGEVKDPSSVARNLAVVSGIETRDLLLLSGRPTQVVEHQNADDLLRKIQTFVDSTAQEIPSGQDAIAERSEDGD